MRICKYEKCNINILRRMQQTRYCSIKCRDKQYVLNRTKRYIIKEKAKIKRRKNVIIKARIPTIITPQASRYQDLLMYSDYNLNPKFKTVMSKL